MLDRTFPPYAHSRSFGCFRCQCAVTLIWRLDACVSVADGCSPRCASPSRARCAIVSLPIATLCCWTSCRWILVGIATRTIAPPGWSPAKRIHRLRLGCTPIRIVRSVQRRCASRSSHSRRLNWLTTRWTRTDRWVVCVKHMFHYIIINLLLYCVLCIADNFSGIINLILRAILCSMHCCSSWLRQNVKIWAHNYMICQMCILLYLTGGQSRHLNWM